MLKKKKLQCDLCVIGGGMAGMAAAISAAREGLNVVLMHERPVLGGNASSEIRMWICGANGEYNRETGILEEIALENLYRNPTKSYAIWDTVLYDFVRREKNITLLLNCTCMDAATEQGAFAHDRSIRIHSITGYQMTTQQFYEVEAAFYSDCSGDSILAPLCGAEFRMGREADTEFGEDTSVHTQDSMTMGMSCMIQGRETNREIRYIPPEWSTKLTEKDFEHRDPDLYNDYENFWYLELGGDRNTISDTETLRDELVCLAAGTWDYIKNSGKFDAGKWDLDFLGFLPGKRESRRMCGEYMVTQRDISDNRVFEDEIAYGGWNLDDHFPGGFYHRGTPNTQIPTPAPYSLPYRALYSKNVDNLFFAGRNISMTHMAMSSIRVMATCALLGEAVGKAAAIAVKNNVSPHDVYREHLEELQTLLMNEDCFLPSKTRKISDVCKNASLSGAGDVIRNGQDRPHEIYHTDESSCACLIPAGEEIRYRFPRAVLSSVHLVFSSDLTRSTLPGSACERKHSMRANQKLDSPQMCMPKTLCREFCLLGELDGRKEEILHITNNRKRCYHIDLNKAYDALLLVPVQSWGDDGMIPVISFDFAAVLSEEA
ncbi:MAG TPA: FAD-dependent oxidoreductase [Candidatus Eisenbergiella merdipullorum]|uniref:FAD-dependent oxidoreductase n=1 Tax=Candidatus Eisenbergiella merdipullorum TaxID=2838553 RepID=A0A9D2I518_9FIRM|nr:FAD-dependent oxidoreductase [Candidatus Eisenbergiella merdipullorum]